MAVTKVISYTTKPECAEENARLVRAVYAELAEQSPEGLQYSTLRLDDGVSFVHIAVLDGEVNPLSTLPAFSAFQAGIGERLATGPEQSDATLVGTYRLLPG
jgi:hypothetical protein